MTNIMYADALFEIKHDKLGISQELDCVSEKSVARAFHSRPKLEETNGRGASFVGGS